MTPTPGRDCPGLRVTLASDATYFFPGDRQLALALAHRLFAPEVLNHPGTTMEYGAKSGKLFVVEEHLAGPPLGCRPDPETPTVIVPR